MVKTRSNQTANKKSAKPAVRKGSKTKEKKLAKENLSVSNVDFDPKYKLFEAATKGIASDIEKGNIFLDQLEQLSWTYPVLKRTPCPFQNCPKCSQLYDTKDKLPICLPCGHTFCNNCIKKCLITPGRGLCPLDNKEFFSLIDFLPVNFALIVDIEEVPQRCSIHRLILIGYCRDCSKLICGRCMFDHKTHNCFDVDSDEALKKADYNYELIANLEASLIKQKNIWAEEFEMMKVYLGLIEQFIKKYDDEKMLKDKLAMDMGLNDDRIIKLVIDLRHLLNGELRALMNKIAECLAKHVGILADLKANFKQMTLLDRLCLCLEHNFDLNAQPSSISAVERLYNALETVEKLKDPNNQN
ncbi:unnamed protein product [Blepharisma stoltei]|uniref:RING-type domain-containing protein n=1 Tax=Blepharisma stoltei TaxID=1481888 RepID=A0AAU9JAW5_9CILI|nr:unnamed protein product [Blepharisma stoltei]